MAHGPELFDADMRQYLASLLDESRIVGGPGTEVAVIHVDAAGGVAARTRRHAYLAALLGIRRIALAVDGMDRVAGPQDAFARIEADFRAYARKVGIEDVVAIPMAASREEAPWYRGPSLTEHLQAVPAGDAGAAPGDVASQAHAVERADQFEATLVWTGEVPMFPGRSYLMAIGGQAASATVAPLKHKVDTDTLEHVAATKLERNEIGVCQLELDQAVEFAPHAVDRERGAFTLADPVTRVTVGAGVIHFALRRSQNVRWQAVDIDRFARAALKGQKPCVLWFTGIPASGKSTIANLVEKKLHAMGRHTYLLDGDNVRHGLNKDLGFTEAARVENIRRIAEVARLMADAGLIVIAAFISPFRSERRMARALLPPGEFLEIFVDAPLAVAESRDPKGLYRKARRGELKNFTGIDSPYERPENPDIRIDSATTSPEEAAERVIEELRRRGG